jgi:RND family efflux transporter MFP subunit
VSAETTETPATEASVRAGAGSATWRTIAAVLAVAALGACDRGEPGAGGEADEAVAVEVSAAVRGAGLESFPATVTSTDEAELATRASGTVRRVRVNVGSRVEAGDTLVELDAEGVEARVEEAEAAVEGARARHERIRALERDGAATEQELDDVEEALRRAEAGLREARAQRGYVALRAPFAGTVVRRDADPGDLAVPGRPILALVRPGSVEIEADLPAAVAARIARGDRLDVRDPETGVVVPARVERISPARDPASRRVRVELVPSGGGGDGPGLSPGGFVRVERVDREVPTVWVPRDAVIRRGQLAGVLTVRDGAVDLRWVRIGAERGPAVEVLAGLEAGDRVVRRPGPAVADGTPVGSVREEDWSPALPPDGGGGTAP